MHKDEVSTMFPPTTEIINKDTTKSGDFSTRGITSIRLTESTPVKQDSSSARYSEKTTIGSSATLPVSSVTAVKYISFATSDTMKTKHQTAAVTVDKMKSVAYKITSVPKRMFTYSSSSFMSPTHESTTPLIDAIESTLAMGSKLNVSASASSQPSDTISSTVPRMYTNKTDSTVLSTVDHYGSRATPSPAGISPLPTINIMSSPLIVSSISPVKLENTSMSSSIIQISTPQEPIFQDVSATISTQTSFSDLTTLPTTTSTPKSIMPSSTQKYEATTGDNSRKFRTFSSTHISATTTQKLTTVPDSGCPPEACLNGGTCIIETEDLFYCDCPPGFAGNLCHLDEDECYYAHDLCQQSCFNTFGSYECSCNEGFRIDDNGQTCTDIDECTEHTDQCEHHCDNMDGSYTCYCEEGFTLAENGYACEDIDHCLSQPCMNNAQCLSLAERYYCLCPDGYTGFKCEVDIHTPCMAGWQKFDGYCYQFQHIELSWNEAETYCNEQHNATLASVHSRRENGFLNRLALDYQWIGFNDLDEEAKFVWSDKSPITYKHWRPGQPNSLLQDLEHCVVMLYFRSGQWNDVPCHYGIKFTCKMAPVGCKELPKIDHASVIDPVRSYGVGQFVQYQCTDGYRVYGTNHVVCQENGQFSEPQFTCIVSCPMPPPVKNAEVPLLQERYFIGDVVKYACKPGYRARGHAFSRCEYDLTWSKPRLVCAGTCPAPTIVKNAVLTSFVSTRRQIRFGQYVYYRCKNGFELSGIPRIKCGQDGEWESPEFACHAGCQNPPSVENARTTIQRRLNREQILVVYVCLRGHEPRGRTLVYCTNGEWTTPKFTCNKASSRRDWRRPSRPRRPIVKRSLLQGDNRTWLNWMLSLIN
ncbi:uncharacterized protein LOC144430572 [Styela clava]